MKPEYPGKTINLPQVTDNDLGLTLKSIKYFAEFFTKVLVHAPHYRVNVL
jgi:hypothetical protein